MNIQSAAEKLVKEFIKEMRHEVDRWHTINPDERNGFIEQYIDNFEKEYASQFQEQKQLSDEEIEKLAEKEYPYEKGSVEINTRMLLRRQDYIKGFKSALTNNQKQVVSEEDLLIIRNKIVDLMPTGDVVAWDMIKAVQQYLYWFDNFSESRIFSKSALNTYSADRLTDNRYVKEKDIEIFNDLTKEEIWHKWQSDKNILKNYVYAMSHYGVTQYSDVEKVAELERENINADGLKEK